MSPTVELSPGDGLRSWIGYRTQLFYWEKAWQLNESIEVFIMRWILDLKVSLLMSRFLRKHGIMPKLFWSKVKFSLHYFIKTKKPKKYDVLGEDIRKALKMAATILKYPETRRDTHRTCQSSGFKLLRCFWRFPPREACVSLCQLPK